MSYTLGQAAQATGKSKMTIQRLIKKGTISANKLDSGEWAIDPAELHRVLPLVEDTGPDRLMLRDGTPNDTGWLQRELEGRDEQIRQIEQQGERERQQLQSTIDDLRRRLDQSEDERRRAHLQITALLTDQRPKEEPPRAPGFWRRLFSR
jgi:excisionase family DNA binding protein